MSKIKTTIREQLTQGKPVQTFTSGTSMEPLLYDHDTWVYILPLDRPLKVGDVPIFWRDDGCYVIHRVVGVGKDVYYTRGDNCIDGEVVPKERMLGRVVDIYRHGRCIHENDPLYRCYAALWVPLRRFYRRVRRKLRRMIKGAA